MSRAYMPQAKSVEWETPQWLFDELDREFHFTLDPCASHSNAKCSKYYTIEDDGLAQSWEGERVFMNPPYGRGLVDWVKKAFYEVRNGCELVVALLPVRTDTRWFHTYCYDHAEIRFLRGRLRFSNDKNSAPFASMIVIWRRKANRENRLTVDYPDTYVTIGNEDEIICNACELLEFMRARDLNKKDVEGLLEFIVEDEQI